MGPASTGMAAENARLLQELQERDDRRRQELERASAIQRRLLPSTIEGWPGVLEIAHRFRPAVETSGDYHDLERELLPGDVVLFSSDGLVEAPAQSQRETGDHLPGAERTDELFGFARLQRSAAHWSSHSNTAEEVAAGIWSDLTAWCGDESHHDDMTLLVLRVPQ